MRLLEIEDTAYRGVDTLNFLFFVFVFPILKLNFITLNIKRNRGFEVEPQAGKHGGGGIFRTLVTVFI